MVVSALVDPPITAIFGRAFARQQIGDLLEPADREDFVALDEPIASLRDEAFARDRLRSEAIERLVPTGRDDEIVRDQDAFGAVVQAAQADMPQTVAPAPCRDDLVAGQHLSAVGGD